MSLKKLPLRNDTVLVCGDRNWTDLDLIAQVLAEPQYDDIKTVVCGGNGYLPSGKACKTTADLRLATRGADALAFQVAEALSMIVQVEFPDWSIGPGGGPVRNGYMLTAWRPGRVIAFHDDLLTSKGTKNMVMQAEQVGADVRKVSHGR